MPHAAGETLPAGTLRQKPYFARVTCREYVKNGLAKFEALAGHNLAQPTIQPDDLAVNGGRPDAGAELIALQWRPATLIEDIPVVIITCRRSDR